MRAKLLLLFVFTFYTLFSNAQVIGSDIKDCVNGTYTYTDEYGRVYKLIFDYSLKLEIASHVYTSDAKSVGGKTIHESRYIGPVYFVGKWGSPDENTINIFYGNIDESKTDMTKEKGAGFFAYQHQNAAVRAPFNKEKGEIILKGQTYKKVGGPCKQNTNSNDGNTSNNNNVNQPQVSLVYTGYESNAEKFRDEYIKTFSTNNEFNAYASGMNVKRIGEALAKDISNNLKQIQGLVNTTDPLVLLQDFNQKITQIESLEANFNQQYNSYSFQTGQQLGNSIGNKDYESAIFQGLGLLNASLERREAQKQMEAQKEALYEERRSQMSKIYWKAVDYNNTIKQNYIKRAAFSEKLEDEKFNLAFVENLECHNASMKNNFSVSNTAWLENKCLFPKKSDVLNIFSSGTSKDVFYLNLAAHKYKQFEKLGYIEFQEAAIHYTAQAITIKPTAERFATLAMYYRGFSDIYELSNYLTAQSYNKNALNNEQLERVEWLKLAVEEQLYFAVLFSDVDFINIFIQTGFDKIFSVKGKDIIDFSIEMDRAELVIKLLNNKFTSMSDAKRELELKRIVALSIAYDSHLTLQELYESGSDLTFKINGLTIVELIQKVNALRCFSIYLVATGKYDKVSHFFDGYSIVQKGNLVGCIDSEGNEIISPVYIYLRFPNEGIVVGIDKNQKYGALDLQGNIVIPFDYDYLGDCVEGLMIARKEPNGKFGYLNRNGRSITDFVYSFAENFQNGAAKVGNYNLSKGIVLYGLIDNTGKIIVNIEYSYIDGFINDLAVVRKDYPYFTKEERTYIDRMGKNIFPSNYPFGKIEIGQSNIENRKSGIVYFLDKKQVVFKFYNIQQKKYFEIKPPLQKGEKINWVNRPPWSITVSSDYIILGLDKEQKTILFDVLGNLINKDLVQYQLELNQRKNFPEEVIFIGNTKVPYKYGMTTSQGFRTSKDVYNYLVENEKASGLSEHLLSQPCKIPCIYQKVKDFSEGLAAVLTINGKWAYIDKEGKEILPPIYDAANSFSSGVATVLLNGQQGYIDKAGNFMLRDLGASSDKYLFNTQSKVPHVFINGWYHKKGFNDEPEILFPKR
jgi:hypothetical protein